MKFHHLYVSICLISYCSKLLFFVQIYTKKRLRNFGQVLIGLLSMEIRCLHISFICHTFLVCYISQLRRISCFDPYSQEPSRTYILIIWWIGIGGFHCSAIYLAVNKEKLLKLEEQHRIMVETHEETEQHLLRETAEHEETRMQVQNACSAHERTQQELEGKVFYRKKQKLEVSQHHDSDITGLSSFHYMGLRVNAYRIYSDEWRSWFSRLLSYRWYEVVCFQRTISNA